MRYLCVHCDERFEDPGAQKPRCPKCMRVHGVRPLEADGDADATAGVPSPARRRRWLVPVVAVVVLALTGGAFLTLRHFGKSPGAASGGAATALQAIGTMPGARDARVEKLGSLLVATDAVEAFAERATEGVSGSEPSAAAIVKAIRARAAAQAFVPWSRVEPKAEAPLVAAEVLDALGKDGARLHLYPLEVVALAVAALRSQDVPARVAEVFRFEGDRAPPDPSARLGYFLVAVPRGEAGAYAFFDPYAGREVAPKADDHSVLEDAEAVGAALALEASSMLAHNEEPAGVLGRVDLAVKLAPRSPSVRVTRASALLANAGVEEGARELAAAVQLRDDGPRHHALAMLHLARGDRDLAQREVSLALEQYPEYAAAQVTLALLHMGRGERDEARATLDKAAALDPELPSLPLVWAQWYAAAGDVEQAITQAGRAIERNPTSIEGHLTLAGIYRHAGRYDDMRSAARKVLSLVSAGRRQRMEMMLRSMLGPTALEPGSDDVAALEKPDAGESSTPEAGSGKLRLLDRDLGGAPEPASLQLGADPPKLRLREPSPRLELER